jgi:hypothetical protein
VSSAGSCPVCSGPVEYAGTGRRPVHCGKRCRQARYRSRLAAERAEEYAGYLLGQLAQVRGELAEASGDTRSILGILPAPGGPGALAWPAGDAAAYADRMRRLASRVCDLAAAYRRAIAEAAAARAALRRAEASAPVGDETPARSVARSPAAAAAT